MTPSRKTCDECGHTLLFDDEIFNFISAESDPEEKQFYDRVYSGSAAGTGPLRPKDMEYLWHVPYRPEARIVRQLVGDLEGQAILFIGNGTSPKELSLICMNPWRFVYSDISPYASAAVRQNFDFGDHVSALRFAAIDAEDLPFADNNFDVVYGYAVVHHLDDVQKFLAGVFQILRPGGRAIFLDDAYSPIWDFSKKSWLKPLMHYSHAKTGISPADYRFSMSGGFREMDLHSWIRDAGGIPFSERVNFLPYLASRAIGKLLPRRWHEPLRRSILMRSLVRIDSILGRIKSYKKNQIRIIWGFDKPLS